MQDFVELKRIKPEKPEKKDKKEFYDTLFL